MFATHLLHRFRAALRPLLRAVALLLSLALPLASQAAPLDDLRRLVEASRFDEAWQLGQRHPDLLGNAHFDFLYGVAAVNSGHVPEGLLALERHLNQVPANDRARLELAAGYFQIGEHLRARSEFELVLRFSPSPAVRRKIDEYLLAMQLGDAVGQRASSQLYIEGGAGRDTNTNGGTFHDEVASPFGALSLAGQPAQGRAGNFAYLAAGVQAERRVTPQVSVFAGADLDMRHHDGDGSYDLDSLALNTGVSRLQGAGLYKLTLTLAELRIGGHRYRDTLGLAGEGQWTLSPTLVASARAHWAETRHDADNAGHDGRLVGLAGMLSRQYPGAPGAPTAGVRLSWTQEQVADTQLQSYSGQNLQLRLFGTLRPYDRLSLAAAVTAIVEGRDQEDLLFGVTRRDRALALDGSATWAIDARWSLRAELFWQRRHSNLPLFDFRRTWGGLKLRYQI